MVQVFVIYRGYLRYFIVLTGRTFLFNKMIKLFIIINEELIIVKKGKLFIFGITLLFLGACNTSGETQSSSISYPTSYVEQETSFNSDQETSSIDDILPSEDISDSIYDNTSSDDFVSSNDIDSSDDINSDISSEDSSSEEVSIGGNLSNGGVFSDTNTNPWGSIVG